MEDCDWTDLPCTSSAQSAALDIDENCVADSSPEISVMKELLLSYSDNDIKNYESKEDGENVKASSKEKQEKDSCPICLSSFEDRSFLDQCFHSFCFCCILQWCEVVQTCPLCKAGFASVIHNVKSMQDYEQYIVEKKKENEQTANDVQRIQSYNERGFNEYGQRFRYRTTRFMRNNESNNTRSEIEQHRETISRQRLSEGWGNEATVRRRSRNSRTKNKGLEKRRQVYSFNLRATSFLGHGKRSRNISSQFFKTYQGCTHRLIPWLARDLKVLLGNNEEEVNFLMEFILSLITRIDMDSSEFVEELRPFLLQTTEHFVHELLSFAKAPFDMVAYDDCVVYPWPDESSRGSAPRFRDHINDERGDVVSPPVTENTPNLRCPWSETPVMPQVSCDQDSTGVVRENLPPVEVNQIVEVDDSTDSSMTMGEESTKTTKTNVLKIDHKNLGLGRDENQSSLTYVSPSEAAEEDSVKRKELQTAKKREEAEHIHHHIHRHVHKHTHEHSHKHRHKHRHKCKYKHKAENKQEYKHKHKHKFRRRRISDPKSESMRDDDSSTVADLPSIDIPVCSFGPSGSETQMHSPKLEDMRKEIDELNVLIQQHEDQLSYLTRKAAEC